MPPPSDALSDSLRALLASALDERLGPAVRQAVEDALPAVVRRAALPPYLTKRDLSALTGWSERKIDYLREKRRLPSIKRGRTVLFETSGVEAYLDEGRIEASVRGRRRPGEAGGVTGVGRGGDAR